jgi:hypothetical protein
VCLRALHAFFNKIFLLIKKKNLLARTLAMTLSIIL